MAHDPLFPKHGGYRKLKSFQIGQLIYDITVQFCDRFISKRSRTHDQMVQAARSGVQNIAEGSMASATSKKFELKLTNVARASLEELRLDFEDFLRQRSLPLLKPGHAVLKRFKALRCSTVEDVRGWLQKEKQHTDKQDTDKQHTDKQDTDKQGHSRTITDNGDLGESVSVRACPCVSIPEQALVANATLSLLNLCCYLLDRQIDAQAGAFMKDGGFTERLYKMRSRSKRS